MISNKYAKMVKDQTSVRVEQVVLITWCPAEGLWGEQYVFHACNKLDTIKLTVENFN